MTRMPPSRNGSARPDYALGSEPAAEQRAEVDRRRRSWLWLVVHRPVHAGNHPLHLLTDAAIEEPRELVDRVVGAAPRRVRVERARHGQVVSRARQCDVHEATLLLELLVIVDRARHREPPIGSPDEEHCVPFLSLRAVCGAEYEHVTLLVRTAGQVLCGLRWLEGKCGKEGFAAGITACDCLELIEVGQARLDPVVL